MKRKEVVHAVPGVQQNMRTGKIVKFTGIHHVGKQFAFAVLEGFVNEPYGLEIRHVYVERTLIERTSLHSLHRRSAILSSRDIFHYHSGNVKSWSWRLELALVRQNRVSSNSNHAVLPSRWLHRR